MIGWDRMNMRGACKFLFYLLMVALPTPQQRGSTLTEAIATKVPTTFQREDLVRIEAIFTAYDDE